MFDEDLSLFFDVQGGFAVDAVFTIAGAPVTRPAIFTDPTQSVELYETRVEADAPFLLMQESHLAGVARGVAVAVAAGSFRVERVTHDGTGLATVYLS